MSNSWSGTILRKKPLQSDINIADVLDINDNRTTSLTDKDVEVSDRESARVPHMSQ